MNVKKEKKQWGVYKITFWNGAGYYYIGSSSENVESYHLDRDNCMEPVSAKLIIKLLNKTQRKLFKKGVLLKNNVIPLGDTLNG